MDFREWTEKASDNLAKAVAKAVQPFYKATRPAQSKKSSKSIENDANANYIYINSLSKVSNKSCPVRDKQVTSASVKMAKPVTKSVTKPATKPATKSNAKRPAMQAPTKPRSGGKEELASAFLTALNQYAKSLSASATRGLQAIKKIQLPSLSLSQLTLPKVNWQGVKAIDWRQGVSLEQLKTFVTRYPLQLAGTAGALMVLVVGISFYGSLDQVPVVGDVPLEEPVEKQIVENSFNSTQTIMLEDRVPGKADLSDVVSMEGVRSYSKPGYEGFAIAINGDEVGFFKEQLVARGVLEQIKSQYAAPTKGGKIEKIFFKERVSVVAGYRPVGSIADYSDPSRAAAYIQRGGNEAQIYTVEEGETFWDIAVKNNISVDSLLAANPDIKPERLQIGDELSLMAPRALVTVCVVEKAKFNELIPYEVKYVEAKSLFKGDSNLKANGKNGEKVVAAELLRENGKLVARNVLSETILSQPVTKVVAKGTKIKPKTAATGKFARPIGRGASFSSDFGWRWGRRHTGVDLSCHIGTSVFAADGGTVVFAGNYQAYGKCVIISHGNGLQTYYAHNSKLLVSAGSKVYKGQKIALSGNTGRSTGPHLHFEVRRGGTPVDPEKYLRLR